MIQHIPYRLTDADQRYYLPCARTMLLQIHLVLWHGVFVPATVGHGRIITIQCVNQTWVEYFEKYLNKHSSKNYLNMKKYELRHSIRIRVL